MVSGSRLNCPSWPDPHSSITSGFSYVVCKMLLDFCASPNAHALALDLCPVDVTSVTAALSPVNTVFCVEDFFFPFF